LIVVTKEGKSVHAVILWIFYVAFCIAAIAKIMF